MNDACLDGLTHSQAVATLKATISLNSVSLTIMEVSWGGHWQQVQCWFYICRDLKQVLEPPISSQVGCSGRSFLDSCNIPKLSSSIEEMEPAGDSPLSVSVLCPWHTLESILNQESYHPSQVSMGSRKYQILIFISIIGAIVELRLKDVEPMHFFIFLKKILKANADFTTKIPA